MSYQLPYLSLFPPGYQEAIQRMRADYEGVFGGRAAKLAILDAFVADGQPSYALLLHWLAQDPQRQTVVLMLALSRRYQTAVAQVALAALATALAGVHGETLAGQAMAPDQLRPLIAEYLRRDAPSDQRLLLIIDGMDEAVGWDVNHELFPPQLGQGIQVLGAARQLAHTSAEAWLAQLGWPASAAQFLDLPPLGPESIAHLSVPDCPEVSARKEHARLGALKGSVGRAGRERARNREPGAANRRMGCGQPPS